MIKILIRHAQGEPVPQLENRDRTLTLVDVERAYKVAGFLHRKRYIPDYSLSSPANRTLHTVVIFSKTFNIFSLLRIEEVLYIFSIDQLEMAFRTLAPHFKTTILFGHKTGITDFVNTFGNLTVDNVTTAKYSCAHI
ncbi:MAG: SixA phosphatase family protein [Flavobacteriales bacterium AspAUS03]